MNFKRFHESKNLFDADTWYGAYKQADGTYQTNRNTWYTLVAKPFTNDDIGKSFCFAADVVPSSGNARFAAVINGVQINGQYADNRCKVSFTVQTIDDKIIFDYGSGSTTITTVSNIMLNTGSQPLPYEPYSSEVWHDIPYYQHKTATDTLTTLPADVYANDTTATVGLKGDMQQSSQPSPTAPIQPQECGDLETTGEHTGQYKIPISSASTTTPVYLGEVESTRRIRKKVLDGTETTWTSSIVQGRMNFNWKTGIQNPTGAYVLSTHYKSEYAVREGVCFITSNNVSFIDSRFQSLDDFKNFLADEYAAGHPVTVWYVNANPTTGIVNDPIRKIGTYADEVSGITIPTIAGANTIDIDTTLKPSEVTVNYHGWHPVTDVHERDSGQWD